MPGFTIMSEGVAKLLKDLQSNKATGPDGISGRLLRLAADEIAPSLALIFNKSISTGLYLTTG